MGIIALKCFHMAFLAPRKWLWRHNSGTGSGTENFASHYFVLSMSSTKKVLGTIRSNSFLMAFIANRKWLWRHNGGHFGNFNFFLAQSFSLKMFYRKGSKHQIDPVLPSGTYTFYPLFAPGIAAKKSKPEAVQKISLHIILFFQCPLQKRFWAQLGQTASLWHL